MPPENVLKGLLQERITSFRPTLDSICDVQPKSESRSRGAEITNKLRKNGQTTHVDQIDKDTQFQSPE